jgi:hypothetical protein
MNVIHHDASLAFHSRFGLGSRVPGPLASDGNGVGLQRRRNQSLVRNRHVLCGGVNNARVRVAAHKILTSGLASVAVPIAAVAENGDTR